MRGEAANYVLVSQRGRVVLYPQEAVPVPQVVDDARDEVQPGAGRPRPDGDAGGGEALGGVCGGTELAAGVRQEWFSVGEERVASSCPSSSADEAAARPGRRVHVRAVEQGGVPGGVTSDGRVVQGGVRAEPVRPDAPARPEQRPVLHERPGPGGAVRGGVPEGHGRSST